jgi:putative tryptophan/tyrosine transport system substrate-binding protein
MWTQANPSIGVSMRRRDFLAMTLGAAAVVRPQPILAQQEPMRPLVGLLSPLSQSVAARNIAAFRSALRDLGYVDGRNMTLALRYGDGASDRMVPLARELIALKPDVIVAGAHSGALAAYNSTRKIPIVVITPQDPVVSGFAQSIARPGGNITGTWPVGDDALVGKRLDFLKLAVPRLARIAVMYNPDYPGDTVYIAKLPAAARALGLSIELIEVRDMRKLDVVGSEVARANVQGLYVLQTPPFHSARREIASMVASLKLPAMYGWRDFADVGGLMSYGPNLPDIYRQSARLVGRILKGEKPGDLPFELPTRYELIVNLKTAKAMGMTISDSFLLLADEVIE